MSASALSSAGLLSLIIRRSRCTAEGYMGAGGVGWEVRMEPGGQSNNEDKADRQIKPACRGPECQGWGVMVGTGLPSTVPMQGWSSEWRGHSVWKRKAAWS